MPSFTTVTLLRKLETRTPENRKDALKLIVSYFCETWYEQSRAMMIGKIRRDEMQNFGIEASDVFLSAYESLEAYLVRHPEVQVENKTHLFALFANNIRFAILEIIRKLKNERNFVSLSGNSKNDEGELSPLDTLPAKQNDNEYLDKLECFFDAIGHLPQEPCRSDSPLTLKILCERRIFLQESYSDIGDAYGMTPDTIANLWRKAKKIITRYMNSKDCVLEYGTRPRILNVSAENTLKEKGILLLPGDIVLSFNHFIYHDDFDLAIHLEKLVKTNDERPDLAYDCELVVERKTENLTETHVFNIPYDLLGLLLEEIEFETAEYSPQDEA